MKLGSSSGSVIKHPTDCAKTPSVRISLSVSVALATGHDAHSRLQPLAVAAPARSNHDYVAADNPVRFIDAFVDTLGRYRPFSVGAKRQI